MRCSEPGHRAMVAAVVSLGQVDELCVHPAHERLAMSLDQHRVFGWLGQAGSVPYYLIPLNLVWSDAGAEADLEHFRGVSKRLRAEPDYWRYLFRCGAWREQLTALTCALVASERGYADEFRDAIRGGSWVSPQLVVGLSLLHPDSARDWLQSEFDSSWLASQPKTCGAFSTAFTHFLLPFTPVAFLTPLDQDVFSVGATTAASYFAFWRSRIQS
jgi:hypothetical protein